MKVIDAEAFIRVLDAQIKSIESKLDEQKHSNDMHTYIYARAIHTAFCGVKQAAEGATRNVGETY